MDSADQPTNSPAIGAEARAVALRVRIRELRAHASAHEPREAAAKASDTRPSSTTEVDGSEFAGSARLINRTSIGTIPATPDPPAPRLRWQYPFSRQLEHTGETVAPPVERSHKTLLKIAPVWLTSAVFHALLLVALALLTYSQTRPVPAIVIAGNRTAPEVIPETSDGVEISKLGSEPDDTLWNSATVDPSPLDLEISVELAAPAFSAELANTSLLSEQLSAAQKVQGSGRLRSGSDGTGAQFYGIQAQGDRFVFIVDSSTSMRFKFAEAKRELESAVRRLNQDQQFYVIFFDRDAERMRLGKWNSKGTRYSMKTQPEPSLVPASSENLDALTYWMNSIQLDSDTNPYPAVVYALRKLKPDAIFLLSDGEFNDGGSTEALLERENIVDHPTNGLSPKTTIHCVGFYSRQGEITLKRIAAANGGTYRFIEPPHELLPLVNPFLGGRGRAR